ncbi:hypothetical protein E2C01_060927 [Portunus trituberculatus]|uniref:Uncharacterized protein n=1 Tax=Portunus trituberculatus TaxID=210409 RepID=A0A5B7HDP2_PORTR|nr:hypothetical protein [Portunus trituberculatus]
MGLKASQGGHKAPGKASGEAMTVRIKEQSEAGKSTTVVSIITLPQLTPPSPHPVRQTQIFVSSPITELSLFFPTATLLASPQHSSRQSLPPPSLHVAPHYRTTTTATPVPVPSINT